MPTVEIYFRDLSPEKQEEILKEYNLTSPEEANWDIIPIITIEVE